MLGRFKLKDSLGALNAKHKSKFRKIDDGFLGKKIQSIFTQAFCSLVHVLVKAKLVLHITYRQF